MRISSINNISMNFQGLWRESTQKTDFDKVMQIKRVEDTYYYHPFADEPQDEISQVVDKHSYADIVEKDGQSVYIIKECKVCSRLPVDSQSYENYMNTQRLSQRAKNIHRIVQNKFINPELHYQKSAVNPEIAKRFKATA